MKKLSYLLSILLVAIFYGCKEQEQPYVGYIVIERAVLEAAEGSTTTLTADTDIPSEILLSVEEGADWCTVSASGKTITVKATQTNPDPSNYRTATVNVRCGYRTTTFTVLQKYEGQNTLQYDWTKWTATGSDVETSDGGGYASLFSEDRTKYWHSQYSDGGAPLPHWLVIDMKEELECISFAIGRRAYGENNYGSVKKLELWVSTNNEDFIEVGGFTFSLPWEASDGTIVEGNSPLIPAEEVISLQEPVTARYVKLVITETNTSNGACQVAYFKAYGKI